MSSLKPICGLSLWLCLAVLVYPGTAHGQAATPSTALAAQPDSTDPDGFFNTTPVVKGINLTVGTTMQHDAASGYSWVFNPGGVYRFNSAFSFEVGTPIFLYLNVSKQVNIGTKAKPVLGYQYVAKRTTVGDTGLAAHFDIHPDLFDYSLTGTLGLPTGTPDYGTGAGQITYNFNNHFEHSFGRFSPDLELGIGDSSSLVNTGVRKSYIAVGLLAYFQLGGSVELPHHINFEADAYEQLPLDRNTIYSTTGKGRKAVTTSTTTGAAEDNGFTTELDIPMGKHSTLSGFYNRSLRDHDDTAGFSLTFSLRPPPKDSEEEDQPPVK